MGYTLCHAIRLKYQQLRKSSLPNPFRSPLLEESWQSALYFFSVLLASLIRVVF